MSTELIDVSSIRYGPAFPTVAVTDLDVALRFYRDVMGFRKVFENGDPVGFMILKKDDARVDLTVNRKHRATTQNVMFMNVDDARALYGICVRNKVRIIKGIRDADYGQRAFVIADPDGNRIDIGQPLGATR
jgi:catechol 2,3-dioxygenase-like lactoylglutathione lyase family enzyme